jgi:very-short-patch-repair endonuclease
MILTMDQRTRQLQKNKFLRDAVKRLNESTPNSELWFKELYWDFKHEDDQFNQLLYNAYIPDIHNVTFKYIIEIDGSIHNRADVAAKDKVKETKWKRSGYDVIRIVAYNFDSFIEGMTKLKLIRQTRKYGKQLALDYTDKTNNKKRTVLRRKS